MSLPSSLLALFNGPASIEARLKDLVAEDPGANVPELVPFACRTEARKCDRT
jgi:hypothetical protein